MPSKFVVFKDKAGEYRFNFKAQNGEIMLQSEGYSSKASCLRGIAIIKENALGADIVEE